MKFSHTIYTIYTIRGIFWSNRKIIFFFFIHQIEWALTSHITYYLLYHCLTLCLCEFLHVQAMRKKSAKNNNFILNCSLLLFEVKLLFSNTMQILQQTSLTLFHLLLDSTPFIFHSPHTHTHTPSTIHNNITFGG